jgi:hypothetical protein
LAEPHNHTRRSLAVMPERFYWASRLTMGKLR